VRVLVVDLDRAWRGGQNQALLLLRGLRARGHAAELLSVRGAPLAARAQAAGVPVHVVPQSSRRWRAAWLLRGLVGEKRFDIVHANEAHALTAAWLGRAHRRVPLAAARRVAFPLSRGRFSLARYRAAACIVAVSHFVAQSVVESGLPASVVEVVHDGVEIPYPLSLESRLRARERWGVAGDAPLLGCVGYLLPEKGQEFLVRAMPAVRASLPSSRLLLVGDGLDRAKLERLADELGIREVVQFAGHVEDISDVYRALDAFVFPSLAEPLGSSLLAAMAWGLPVVALARGGVKEIVEDGRDGLLLEDAAPQSLAAAVVRLLTEHNFARGLGEAGRETIVARFSADRMVESTLAIFERLTATGAPG
jgi:glycosyltransferase involved in cell wall biosynthesis